MRHDVQLALRSLRRSPGYAATAILTLAAGIAANAIVYTLTDAVLLRPLPYGEPERLVTILHGGRNPVSPANFLDVRAQSKSFEQMAAAVAWSPSLTGRDRPEQITGLHVTADLFTVLDVQPAAGRLPTPTEFESGPERVLVIAHSLAERKFGGVRSAVGQTVKLNGAAYTVIGVMPRGFYFAPFWITDAELWAPLDIRQRVSQRGAQYLRVFGRLKPSVHLAQAQSEVDAVWRGLEAGYPKENAGLTMRISFLHEQSAGSVRPALLMLTGAVGFVLLIACATIANLALARAVERRRDAAIRLALGASGSRIIRGVLAEGLVVSIAGGVLGLLMARWGVDVLTAFMREGADQSARLPRLDEISAGSSTYVFAALLTLAAGILFCIAPAIQSARHAFGQALTSGVRGASASGGAMRARSLLVVSQIAICTVLLAGAGLLLRSFLTLRSIDPGFDARGVLTMIISLAGQPEVVGDKRETLYNRIVSGVRALPGVTSASMINHLPLAGDTWGSSVHAEGAPIPQPGERIVATRRVARPDYFATMRIPLLAGRDFGAFDRDGAPRVVIVNRALARRLWNSADVTGRRLTLGDPQGAPAWVEVVGVIADVKQAEWSAEAEPELYLPFHQTNYLTSAENHVSYMTLVARTNSNPAALARVVKEIVWSANKDAPVSAVQTMEQVVAQALWRSRFYLLVVSVFAAFALALACLGVYGVMQYSVASRTREMGIRIALGARPMGVLWTVVREAMILVAVGILGGIAAGVAATRALSTLLYGVEAHDPATFVAVPAALAVTALLAALLGGRRAVSIDPASALRGE
jgi:putative ABC transport system permease protein